MAINELLPFVHYDDMKELPNTKYKMSVRLCKKFPILDLHCQIYSEHEFAKEKTKKE